MESAFQPWIGQPVVVQMALGQIRASVRGILLRDQSETLLMKTQGGSELKIPKVTVLAVEEAADRSAVSYTGQPIGRFVLTRTNTGSLSLRLKKKKVFMQAVATASRGSCWHGVLGN